MRNVILLVVMMLSLTTYAEKKQKVDSIQVVRDSIMLAKVHLLEQIERDLSAKNRYTLYLTENVYNLIELDTQTGKIRQVQWALEPEEEGSFYINGEDLSGRYNHGAGRFELFPTKNMYQFILLDKINGRKWHMQWGLDEEHRWLRKIK